MRLRTLPAEQAQTDWGHFGKIKVGNAMRALMVFLMVLSWSRWAFLRFYLNCNMNSSPVRCGKPPAPVCA